MVRARTMTEALPFARDLCAAREPTVHWKETPDAVSGLRHSRFLPRSIRVAPPNNDFSIGVEEEYQIINPSTRELLQRAAVILPEAQDALGDEVTNELYLSQIEIGTPVCRTLNEVRTQLIRLRRKVIEAAGHHGGRIAAAGTHPFSHWKDQSITPKERYFGIARNYQQLAREQIIFGCHIHIGIQDPEATIQVMNRSRPWLACLAALTCNSPFWVGIDTGYASYRTELFQRFPTVNIPFVFESRAEYDRLVESLVQTGTIKDATRIYWDIRPSDRFQTLEYRVADVCMRVDEAVMVAMLIRALAKTCYDQAMRDEPIEHARPELLRAAKWRASRFGLEGELIDVESRQAIPARLMIERFLAFLRSTLEDLGEWDEIAPMVRDLVDRGTGSARQRWTYAHSGRFEDVVDMIVAETEKGIV